MNIALGLLVLGWVVAATSSASSPPALWNTLAGRAAHTSTSLDDGRILVAGGCAADGCGSASADTFVVASTGKTAVRGPRLLHARDGHTATLLPNGAVALAGGFPGEGSSVLGSVEVVDVRNRTSRVAAELDQPRGGHAAAAVGDGDILVVGGWIGPRMYTSSVELVDPEHGRVFDRARLPIAADALDAVTLPDGRVVVTGGQRRPGVGSAGVFVYDPHTDEWRRGPSLRTARFKHISIALPDGRVLVAGGTSNDVILLKSTEIVDLARNRVTAGPRLAEPRYKMAGGGVRMTDGRIIIGAGGRSVEVLDLKTRRSTVIARFGQRGSFATVNSVGRDRVLVVGGYDDRIAIRRLAKLLRVPPRR